MPKRLINIEEHNQDRWVISYADFITLLFAFFVVMYSVSSVNEGQYKILTKVLGEVFVASKVGTHEQNSSEDNTLIDSAIDFPMPANYNALEDFKYGIEGNKKHIEAGGAEGSLLELPYQPKLDMIKEQIAAEFGSLVSAGELEVVGNNQWISININNNVLFDIGKANPTKKAEEILKRISHLLIQVDNPIRVEGFTDNMPVNNVKFPSNWELSASRAAAIVRLLALHRVEPERMSAVGYAEYKPVESNETEYGRSKNRRVSLVISRNMHEASRINTLDKNKTVNAKNSRQEHNNNDLLKRGIRSVPLNSGELLLTN